MNHSARSYNAINDWLSTITLMMKDRFQHTKYTHPTCFKVFNILLAHWASNEYCNGTKGKLDIRLTAATFLGLQTFAGPLGQQLIFG